MIVAVTGSRTGFKDEQLINDVIGALKPNRILVGDCPTGVDAYVDNWWYCDIYRADWDTHGKAAGPIRNRVMLDEGPDILLAFWDGKSRGTKDCINAAVARGIPVNVYIR